jgi:LacI family transcriptional regulator
VEIRVSYPTVADVAAEAGVSTATVSRVLNDNDRVAPQLVTRVQEAIQKLDYRPSRVAKSLRTRRASVWFLVVSDIRNTFFTDLVGSIEDQARAEGYTLVVCNAETAARQRDCLDLAISEQAAGVVIIPNDPRHTDLGPLLRRDIPVALVDQRLRGGIVDTVLADDVKGAGDAVDHLVDQGCRRIAFLGTCRSITTATGRHRGYRRSLSRHGLPAEACLSRPGDFHETGGYEETLALLALPQPPDGIVVANNPMTVGAIRAVKEAGVRVPDELSLIGFDETPWATIVEPSLTTVGLPTWDMGR